MHTRYPSSIREDELKNKVAVKTYALFTEGTGQGVHERSNVSALAEACVRDGAQRVHLETGPGTRLGTIITGRLFGFDALDILMLHDSLYDATNVWGHLPESARALEKVRHHPICRLLDNFAIS